MGDVVWLLAIVVGPVLLGGAMGYFMFRNRVSRRESGKALHLTGFHHNGGRT